WLFSQPSERCEGADLVYLHLGSPLAEFAPPVAEPVDELAAARSAAMGEHGGRQVVDDDRPFTGEGNTTEPCDQWFPACSFDPGLEAPSWSAGCPDGRLVLVGHRSHR